MIDSPFSPVNVLLYILALAIAGIFGVMIYGIYRILKEALK